MILKLDKNFDQKFNHAQLKIIAQHLVWMIRYSMIHSETIHGKKCKYIPTSYNIVCPLSFVFPLLRKRQSILYHMKVAVERKECSPFSTQLHCSILVGFLSFSDIMTLLFSYNCYNPFPSSSFSLCFYPS